MPYGPTDFRLTVVKPYYIDELSSRNITIIVETRTENKESTINVEPGIVNRENNNIEQATKLIKKRGRRRPRKNTLLSAVYIIVKEKADYELFLKLC